MVPVRGGRTQLTFAANGDPFNEILLHSRDQIDINYADIADPFNEILLHSRDQIDINYADIAIQHSACCQLCQSAR